MKYVAVIFLLGGFLLAPGLGQEAKPTGSITGTVRFLGKVPPTRKILVSDGSIVLHDELTVDPKSKGLRYVAVYLEGAPTGKVRQDIVVIDQRDMVFLPRVVTAQQGQKVRFENSDLSNHGVTANSNHAENTFNVVTPPNQHFEIAFKAQKKPLALGCPLHAWMRAWVLVLPHPFATVTDAQGKFRIPDVPAGKHTLVFSFFDRDHHEKKEVEIRPGQEVGITLEWTQIHNEPRTK